MSKSVKKASEKEQDAPENDLVFDFLYCDTRRIGSFLAQFDDAGHLQQVIQRESVAKGVSRGIELSVGGGATLAGTGGSGNIGFKRSPSEQGSEASERVYDPLWTNARAFMDYLEERNMIERDLASAHMGQFVLASGELEVRDLKLIQKAMTVLKGIVQSRDTQKHADSRNRSKGWHEKHQAEAKEAKASEAGIAFVAMLPHAVHAVLKMKGSSVWCSLNPESLIGSSDDIFLKHGVCIPGEWHILGILDAVPDEEATKEPTEQFASAQAAMTDFGENAPMTLITKGFGGFIDGIAPFARMMLGGQFGSYGMTPLLIFRKVTG